MTVRTFEKFTPKIPDSCFVDEMSLVLGDVEMGEDCSVWPMTVIRGDVHRIRIGARTNLQDGSVLHVTHYSEYYPKGYPLTIGDDVTVGHGVVVHACTIGNRVLLGMHSTILDGAVVDDDVMIGANSLVAPGKKLESGYLYVGSPVKQVRALTDDEITFLKYSAEHYVNLKNRHQK